MKTVKRILAIAVAVLLIAMMIPSFAAEGNNTVNWTCKDSDNNAFVGYTYEVLKVASYNATTGAFTATNNDLAALVKSSATETEMAALASACVGKTLPSAGVADFTTDAGSGSFTVPDGIYYIKLKTKSPNFKMLTQESIVVFPHVIDDVNTKEHELDVNLGGKINEGEPTSDKFFLVDGANNTKEMTKAPQSFGSTADTKTITYVLTATLPASEVDTFIITDKMGTGLDTSKHTLVAGLHNVAGKAALMKNGTTKIKDVGATIITDASKINLAKEDTVNKKNGTGGTGADANTFGVEINTADLVYPAADSTDVYSIEVTYQTELDPSTAVINTAIPNDDALIYGNDSNYNVTPTKRVEAYTYGMQAIKVDANDTTKRLGGATFELYKVTGTGNNKTYTSLGITAVTSSANDATKGIATFDVKLPAGTYAVKETSAPTGYNLNSSYSEDITLNADTPNGIGSATIADTPAKMPATGGAGTLVFTIVGGSLVLLAAALFIVVMKKRSSAK